jgi:glucan 1,3-beta-glucosidase
VDRFHIHLNRFIVLGTFFIMATFSIFTLFATFCLFLLVSSAPTSSTAAVSNAAANSTYWVASIARQGTVAFGASGYQIFRNVQDFGATGNGMLFPYCNHVYC